MNRILACTRAALVPLLMLSSAAPAGQPDLVSPVERSGFTRTTAYDSLQAFLQTLDGLPRFRVEEIGRTVQGRALNVVRISSSPVFGSDPGRLRILLFGQQHGDEPTGKEALTMLLSRIAAGEMEKILEHCDLLIVPQMNPDGAELGQRRTADSIDLNRNHALLTTPNTRALHDLFYRWMPHVSMDIHQYGAYSSSWSDSGFIKAGDVQLGMLTNANTPPAVRALQHGRIFPFIAEQMRRKGYRFHEYIVGSPSDRVRHSTTEINDGRQGLGILGTVAFIQEGIKWMTAEEGLERCVRSQLASVEALLRFCAENADEVRGVVENERRRLSAMAGSRVGVRMEHRSSGAELGVPVRFLTPIRDSIWQVHPYHDEVHLLTATTMPSGYLVRREDSALVSLLHRHHIATETVSEERVAKVTSCVIDSVGWQVLEEDSLPRAFVTWMDGEAQLRPGDAVVSTAQLQSLLITILLEPESMWGLTKYEQFASLLNQKRYPVLRLR